MGKLDERLVQEWIKEICGFLYSNMKARDFSFLLIVYNSKSTIEMC